MSVLTHMIVFIIFFELEYNGYMAKLKLLKKFLIEIAKVDRSRNAHHMPSPMFFNDKDMNGIYHNKSDLRKYKKK
jgi:hypothetical protein